MIFWFGTQNQVGYDLSFAPQNRWEDEDDAGHVSRCIGLLRLQASQARVSQSSLKTGGATTRMVHAASSRMVHVSSSWRSCGSEVKDGRFDGVGCGAVEVEPNYPSLNVIFLLAHSDVLVFWSSL
jgi:hypothetical protein